MKIKDKRLTGSILGRDGISQRIMKLAEDIVNGSYKNAITRAGQISELVDAASYDKYWNEKAMIGKLREAEIFASLFAADGLSREQIISNADPYTNSDD